MEKCVSCWLKCQPSSCYPHCVSIIVFQLFYVFFVIFCLFLLLGFSLPKINCMLMYFCVYIYIYFHSFIHLFLYLFVYVYFYTFVMSTHIELHIFVNFLSFNFYPYVLILSMCHFNVWQMVFVSVSVSVCAFLSFFIHFCDNCSLINKHAMLLPQCVQKIVNASQKLQKYLLKCLEKIFLLNKCFKNFHQFIQLLVTYFVKLTASMYDFAYFICAIAISSISA